MFNLFEVIFLVIFVSGIVAVIAYRYAEFKIITRLLSTLTEKELDRLEEIKDKLDAATTDEEADKIIEEASKSVDLKMVKQEVIDGMIFFYDLSGHFICQGRTTEQAVATYTLVNKYHKGVTCVICDNNNQYYIVNGEIRTTLPL